MGAWEMWLVAGLSIVAMELLNRRRRFAFVLLALCNVAWGLYYFTLSAWPALGFVAVLTALNVRGWWAWKGGIKNESD